MTIIRDAARGDLDARIRAANLDARLSGSDRVAAFTYMTAAELRAVVDDSNSAPPVPRELDYSPLPDKGARVAPLFRLVTTVGDSTLSAEESARGEVTAPTPYATALPESSLTIARSSPKHKRVGAFIPADKDVLEDPGLVRLAIDLLLQADFSRELDEQLVNGDGIGENLNGLVTATFTQQALGTGSRWEALIKSVLALRDAGFTGRIDALMNTTDFQEVLFETDSNGMPLFNRETLDAVGFGGFVPTSLKTAGSWLVGDFKAGAHLYLRSGLTIEVSKEHDNYFVLGKVAIAAQARVEAKVVQASAFREVTGV